MSPEKPDYPVSDPEGAQEIEPIETVPPARPVSPVAAPARGPVRFEPLNLSRRPFLNTRPVVRTSLILWALGLLLLLGNVSRLLSFRESSADKRAQIDRGVEEIMRQEQVANRLQKQLEGFDLEQENRQVDFLNHKIQERTFSWSSLLDRIGERLPNDVRLNRLTPVTGEKTEKELQRSLARRGSGAVDQVPLLITGEARNSEALETFTERLYQPPFDYPNPARQEVQDNGVIKFELSVQYRPGPPAAGAPAGAPAGPAPKIEELPMPGAAGSTAVPGTAPAPQGSQQPPAPNKGVRP